jgi:hypothetical protein
MKEKILKIAQDLKQGTITEDETRTLLLGLLGVSESTLGIPDIRNKLSPITHLISMVERNEPDFIKKAIPQAKESVNYLAQRDVYSR